jgi:hypothetical protein
MHGFDSRRRCQLLSGTNRCKKWAPICKLRVFPRNLGRIRTGLLHPESLFVPIFRTKVGTKSKGAQMKIALTSKGPDTFLQAGLCCVRIVKMMRGKYTSHRLSWKVGKRTFRRSYNDETAALAEAERIVKNLAASEGAATALNSEDAIYLIECRRKLGKIPMHIAVDFIENAIGTRPKTPKPSARCGTSFIKGASPESSARDIIRPFAITETFGKRLSRSN